MRDRRLNRKDDRGSVLIIVSVFSLIAVLLLGAVVDLGNQRAEKKRVTMSTDASALAAAASIDFRGSYAKGVPVDCGLIASTDGPSVTVADVAVQYWTQNGGSGPLDCSVVVDAVQPSTAYVTVSAVDGVDYAFSGATGQSSGSVTGSSSARVAAARGGLLYPVGLCTEGAEIALTQAGPDGRFLTAHPTTVTFDAACGGSGNKRQIQFDVGLRGNSCGGVGMWCWDFNNGGYDGNGAIPQIVESDTGKDWQKAEATIEALATAKTHLWIPAVRSRPDLPQSGTFAKYEITHFVEVQITSYSKRQGLGFLVHRIVEFDARGPEAPSDVHTARVHLCGTGQGEAACDVKTAPPPPYAIPDPVLDFRDLCKVTAITPSVVQQVRVGADDKLTTAVTVNYTVENPANCDTPVRLQATAPGRTVDATAGTPSGNTYPFSFPVGTPMGPDGTEFVLQFIEGGYWADNAGRLSVLGPCRLRGVVLTPTKEAISTSGNALAENVTLRVDVSRPESCTNLTVRVEEQKTAGSNPVINDVYSGSPTTATFNVSLPIGSKTYQNNTIWEVFVLKDGVRLAQAPAATFKT